MQRSTVEESVDDRLTPSYSGPIHTTHDFRRHREWSVPRVGEGFRRIESREGREEETGRFGEKGIFLNNSIPSSSSVGRRGNGILLLLWLGEGEDLQTDVLRRRRRWRRFPCEFTVSVQEGTQTHVQDLLLLLRDGFPVAEAADG